MRSVGAAGISGPSVRFAVGGLRMGYRSAGVDNLTSLAPPRAWADEQLDKMQRMAGLEIVDELPRNSIGTVLKLQDCYAFRIPA
jgi:hypothetical protein